MINFDSTTGEDQENDLRKVVEPDARTVWELSDRERELVRK